VSQFVGRFVIISVFVAAILLGLGMLILGQPGVRLSKFEQAQASYFQGTKPEAAPLNKIQVTPCAPDTCLLIQAGGREFVVGASASSAEGLLRRGLLTENLDGVLLTDLGSSQIQGLIGLRDRSLEVGRRTKLKIYGPSGVERVVEGLNAMLETSDVDRSVRYGQGVLPFDIAQAEAFIVDEQPDEVGIFDSGVLQVSAFPVQSTLMGAEVLYRFDYEDQSLIVGGCGVRRADIVSAEEGAANNKIMVLPVTSKNQLEIIRKQARNAGFDKESRFTTAPIERCLTVGGLQNLAVATGIESVIASPLYPYPLSLAEEKIWVSEARQHSEESQMTLVFGEMWQSNSYPQ